MYRLSLFCICFWLEESLFHKNFLVHFILDARETPKSGDQMNLSNHSIQSPHFKDEETDVEKMIQLIQDCIDS